MLAFSLSFSRIGLTPHKHIFNIYIIDILVKGKLSTESSLTVIIDKHKIKKYIENRYKISIYFLDQGLIMINLYRVHPCK